MALNLQTLNFRPFKFKNDNICGLFVKAFQLRCSVVCPLFLTIRRKSDIQLLQIIKKAVPLHTS